MIVTKSMISMNLESITRTPSGMVCTEGGSLGFDFSSSLRLNPPVACGDSPR